MSAPQAAPYGAWRSPISADLVASASVRLGDSQLDSDDVYWGEGRPAERGRNVVVRRAGGTTRDLTPEPYNVRTRVHEYGGGAFVVEQGTLYFANFADQRVYRQEADGQPTPLTPDAAYRYADFVVDRGRGRLICVREDHTANDQEPENTIVGLGLAGESAGGVLARGYDFYASPRLSPDGSRLAYLAWRHPNMPWDGCELWLAEIAPDGSLGAARLVAGGPEESIFQPEWSPDGILHFVSDRTGWWNLYRWRDGRVEPLCPMAAEFGRAQWVFGISTYAFESAERIVCSYTKDGAWHLARLDTRSLALAPIDLPYTEVSGVHAAPGRAVFSAGSPTDSTAIVELDLTTGRIEVLRRSSGAALDSGYLSTPRPIEFPTEGGLTAHALFYPPRNRDFVAPHGEKPPLLVKSHGGPTGSTSTTLRAEFQFWTSRGIAVLDVDYGGSTGYGRAYRERLHDQWGIVDVDDCVNAARYLVARGEVDGARLAISGGSAGGYTTLSALTFRDVFRAGASYYGVSDLEGLATDTHKFESRYLDRIVGPYPARRDLYLERSPIHHTDRLARPAIFFQGLEDKVVPPDQTERMAEALRRKGLPVAALYFTGEQHGFRQAANIRRALEAELYFYSRLFGFRTADQIEPVAIENLP